MHEIVNKISEKIVFFSLSKKSVKIIDILHQSAIINFMTLPVL